MRYIFGDIHGELDTLIKLISKLPDFTDGYFVGDLIDRGPKSREVIKFIRDNNFKCVLGNHEDFMIDYGDSFIRNYPKKIKTITMSNWYDNGGDTTLFSYGLIKYKKGISYIKDDTSFLQFKDDVKWLKRLPLYIELPDKINGKPIVISHGSCSYVWWKRNSKNDYDVFRKNVLKNRTPPKEDSIIYNIYGHTIINDVDTSLHYINLDTGCHKNKEVNPSLSAYCIETGKVYNQYRVK